MVRVVAVGVVVDGALEVVGGLKDSSGAFQGCSLVPGEGDVPAVGFANECHYGVALGGYSHFVLLLLGLPYSSARRPAAPRRPEGRFGSGFWTELEAVDGFAVSPDFNVAAAILADVASRERAPSVSLGGSSLRPQTVCLLDARRVFASRDCDCVRHLLFPPTTSLPDGTTLYHHGSTYNTLLVKVLADMF